jgi:hypothetical protein
MDKIPLPHCLTNLFSILFPAEEWFSKETIITTIYTGAVQVDSPRQW